MVDDAGEDQRTANIEGGDSGRPLEGVGFPVGGAQGHDAGDVEGAGAHEGQCLCFADGCL